MPATQRPSTATRKSKLAATLRDEPATYESMHSLLKNTRPMRRTHKPAPGTPTTPTPTADQTQQPSECNTPDPWDEEQFTDEVDGTAPKAVHGAHGAHGAHSSHELDLQDSHEERLTRKSCTPTRQQQRPATTTPTPPQLTPSKKRPATTPTKRTITAAAFDPVATLSIGHADEDGDEEPTVNTNEQTPSASNFAGPHEEWKRNRAVRRVPSSPSVSNVSKSVPWYKAARRQHQIASLPGVHGVAPATGNTTPVGVGDSKEDPMEVDEELARTNAQLMVETKAREVTPMIEMPAKRGRPRKQIAVDKGNDGQSSAATAAAAAVATGIERQRSGDVRGQEGGQEEVADESEEEPPLQRRRKSALQKLQEEIVHAADPIILPGRTAARRATRSGIMGSPIAAPALLVQPNFNETDQNPNTHRDDRAQSPPHTPTTSTGATRGRRRKLPTRTVVDPKEWDITQDVSQASVTSPTKIDEDASESFSPSKNKKRRIAPMRASRDGLAPITMGVSAGVKEDVIGKPRTKRVLERKAKLKGARGGSDMLVVVSPNQEEADGDDDEDEDEEEASEMRVLLPLKRARVDRSHETVPSSQPLSLPGVDHVASKKMARPSTPTQLPNPDAIVIEIVKRRFPGSPRKPEHERSMSPSGQRQAKGKGKARANENARQDDDDDNNEETHLSTFDENAVAQVVTTPTTPVAESTPPSKTGPLSTLASLSRPQSPREVTSSVSRLAALFSPPTPSFPHPSTPHKFATPAVPADTLWSRARATFSGSPASAVGASPPSVVAVDQVRTSNSSAPSVGAAGTLSSQRPRQDRAPGTPDRKHTASPHGSINGNGRKWGIKEWHALEDWYERESGEVEKAAEGFWKEHRITIKGEPGRDGQPGQVQEIEIWSREEVFKRCKALHRNITKNGGESPRKRYRYSSVSSTSSIASIASIASRTSVLAGARAASMGMDVTMSRSPPFGPVFSTSYHTPSPLSAPSHSRVSPMAIRRLSDIALNSGDGGSPGAWINFGSTNVQSTLNRMETESIDGDMDAALTCLRLESTEPGSRRGSMGSIMPTGRNRVRDVVEKLERQEMERQEEERRRSRSRTYSPSFKPTPSQSFATGASSQFAKESSSPDSRTRALTPNNQRGHGTHVVAPMPERSVSTPLPKKTHSGQVPAPSQSSSSSTSIFGAFSRLIGWSTNNPSKVRDGQEEVQAEAQDTDVMEED